MTISSQAKGNVYALATSHPGVYFTPEVTHVVALDNGSHCFALVGDKALPDTYGESRIQYVNFSYLTEVDQAEWGAAHDTIYGERPEIAHPTYLSSGAVALIEDWLTNGIDDIPRVTDIVDATTMMLSRLLVGTLPADGASKTYVGTLLDIKRWNLQHRDDLPVGTVVTLTETGARRLGYTYSPGDQVVIWRYKDTDGDYIVVRQSAYVEGQEIHSYSSSDWGYAKDEDFIVPTLGQEEPIGTTWEGPAKALGWVSPEGAEALRNQMSSYLRQVREANERHQADITLIGQVLVDEARSREWCSEFEQVVNRRLNPNLHLSLPVRAQDVDVTVTGWIRVPFSVVVTVSDVDGDDVDEEAERLFNDNYNARSLMSDAYTDTYSAEVEDDLEFEQE